MKLQTRKMQKITHSKTILVNDSRLPSERHFGLLMVITSICLCGVAYFGHWGSLSIKIFLAIGAIFGLVTLIIPRALAPLNQFWFQIGLLLGKFVSPIVLGIMFFGLLTPVALISRILGRDILNLRRRNVQSYWIKRAPDEPNPDSFKNQF